MGRENLSLKEDKRSSRPLIGALAGEKLIFILKFSRLHDFRSSCGYLLLFLEFFFKTQLLKSNRLF